MGLYMFMYCCFNDHVRIKRRNALCQEIRLYIESGVPEACARIQISDDFHAKSYRSETNPADGRQLFPCHIPSVMEVSKQADRSWTGFKVEGKQCLVISRQTGFSCKSLWNYS